MPSMTAVFCVMCLAAPSAHSPSLSGIWAVKAEGATVATDDGGSWSVSPVSGSLTLDQNGKMVRGHWQGQMPAAWALAGEITEQTFELQTEWREISISRNGEQSTVRARWSFRGKLSGDTASGTMSLELPGGERPQPFTATRTP